MDASPSPDGSTEVYGIFLQIENSPFTHPKKNTVIKYTKLPDFDFNSKPSWPQQSYTLHPRLRRIVSVDSPNVMKSCSLTTDVMASKATSNYTKRKIVTITEDDECVSRIARTVRKPSAKTISRSLTADFKDEKQSSQRNTSRLTNPSKFIKEPKLNSKANNTSIKKEVNVTKLNTRNKFSNYNLQPPEDIGNKKCKETIRNMKSAFASSKDSISKNLVTTSESEKAINVIKNKISNTNYKNSTLKKQEDRHHSNRSSPIQFRTKETFLKSKNKPVTVIHVPLVDNCRKRSNVKLTPETSESSSYSVEAERDTSKVDCSMKTELEEVLKVNQITIGTNTSPTNVDKETEIDPIDLKAIQTCIGNTDVQTEVIKEIFDSLQIPNVTLTKEKSDSKDEIVHLHSKSLPNLKMPTLKVISSKEANNANQTGVYKSSSYIISRATVTCTTRQKIDFHVVEEKAEETSNLPPIPLPYPMNVMTVIKKEMSNSELSDISFEDVKKKKIKSHMDPADRLNEPNRPNCSYVFNSNKLVKPSDIISTIRLSNGLLQNDYICEQFQNELNFIDSFFESLQYLENCSLSENSFPECKVYNWIDKAGLDFKSSDYGSFLPRLENGIYSDDTETMASKNLCLLNLLIRDEQRRAKNLLFVLKMREDALKDFTKSQILWLEDKKKLENIDISTLKKKQRGALLKLQHECGEMQRMRKALLALTEKRKAFVKTKKNIELKLSDSLNVDQIILGKKKLKKTTYAERATTPLKCFDLSSSGCEDSTTSRAKSDMPLVVPETLESNSDKRVTSAEKSIQTSDSLGTLLVDQSTDTAAENFVAVDGGYLNILFHNLSIPQIFSYGKPYEVNEEALKKIVIATNANHNSLNDTGEVQKLVDQIKSTDDGSPPSTARSLVEEMDQYYKGLTDADKSPGDISEQDYSGDASEVKEISNQAIDSKMDQIEGVRILSVSTMTTDSSGTIEKIASVTAKTPSETPVNTLAETEEVHEKEPVQINPTGPLPVPPGAAVGESPDVPLWLLPNASALSIIGEGSSSVSSQGNLSMSSMSSLTSPVHCEAEELRRQQLAIEREIKALEQQQCQLLVVREIPDKPPPPYTPPTELRMPKTPRMFLADHSLEHRVARYITEPDSHPIDPTDGFEVFLNDFCHENQDRQKVDCSDKPWDACNLLPQKAELNIEKLFENTSNALTDVLLGVTPPIVSGMGSRRSDHIDDILFTEWRRCEPEWTALHTDEAAVKNQLFESIFQKILTETVDEYKKIVQCNKE